MFEKKDDRKIKQIFYKNCLGYRRSNWKELDMRGLIHISVL